MNISKSYKELRIFLASPGDLTKERNQMKIVVEELNRSANRLGANFNLLEWHRVVPDMGRPQQVIFDQLKPEEWDLFIGILWHRFGTETGAKYPDTDRGFFSGTEEEFYTAYSLWKSHRRPRIMFYHCVRPIAPDKLDPDQLKRVNAFLADFAHNADHPGIYQSFRSTAEFVKRIREDLMQFLLDYNEQKQSQLVSPPPLQALNKDSEIETFFEVTNDISQDTAKEEAEVREVTIPIDLDKSKIVIAIVQLEGPFPNGKHMTVIRGRESYEWVSLDGMRMRIRKVCDVIDSINHYHQKVDIIVFPEYSFPVEQAIEKIQAKADQYNQIVVAGADSIRQPESLKIFVQCPIIISGKKSPLWVTKQALSRWEQSYVDQPDDVINPLLTWKADGQTYWLSVCVGLDFAFASQQRTKGGGIFIVPMCSPDIHSFRGWADAALRLENGTATVFCNCVGGEAVGQSGLVALVPHSKPFEPALNLPISDEAVAVFELDCKHLASSHKADPTKKGPVQL
jgi:predicted amidohydrolase